MIIDIKAVGLGLTPGLRNYVTERISASMGRLGSRIRRVLVRLSDLNGPRGGLDKQCQLMLRIDGAPPIVVRDTEEDLYVAVDRAAERARRTLTREVKWQGRFTERRSASGELT